MGERCLCMADVESSSLSISIAETQTQLNERHLPVARTYTHLNGCFFIGVKHG